jgi:hypothetical protein
MLDPETRYIYLDQLKPPAGYVLDRAVGTTFSLDLLTLLIAPLAMVFYESQERDLDPTRRIEFVEALQRVAGRLVIFCQKGRISVPKTDTLLYSYLEPVVVEAQPEGGGVFHPKTWLLRFTAENQPVVYRFLCLSRNLTFDHSWDTVLSLEGVLQERKVGFSKNSPLRSFVRSLPGMAQRELPLETLKHVELLAEEAGRVIFEAPPEFSPEFTFVPSGISGYRYPRLFKDSSGRMAVISPFITPECLTKDLPGGQESILISRGESLDALSENQHRELCRKFRLYTMHETAHGPDPETGDEQQDILGTDDPRGLHAKLYIAEKGANVLLATGSANATRAAFRGHNVEFMVMLGGKKKRCGIDRLFGDDPEHPFPGKLFREYERPGEPPAEANITKELERILEEARQALLKAPLQVQVQFHEEGLYNMLLHGLEWPDLFDVSASCHPITLKKEHARELMDYADGEALTFAGIPPAGLTGFFAFRLEAKYKGQERKLAFVLNLPVEGMPEERDREILLGFIADSKKFVRYLLFLLAEEQDVYHLRDIFETGDCNGDKGPQREPSQPLLEELVRAYSRQPAKIARIARLVSELEQSEKGEELLPEDFRQVWAVLEAARKEAALS